MSRWIQLKKTTPSGKTLFICQICGSGPVPLPDNECTENGERIVIDGKTCKEWDDEFTNAMIHPVHMSSLLRTGSLLRKLLGGKTAEQKRDAIRRDRETVLSLVKSAVLYMTTKERTFNPWDLERRIETIREAVGRR